MRIIRKIRRKWVFILLCFYLWVIFILSGINLRCFLTQGEIKKWEKGTAGGKKENEKGRKDAKFCLKWKLLT